MSAEFSTILLRWFAQNGRELPWRATQDPYAIWLSEIILQQTRVQQGWAYWERFMRRFPNVEQLAAASEDEVLRLWQGLGYYSRARNLHTAAQQIVSMGRFPTTFEEILGLKGVGEYTAAAVGSIAFGLPVAVVDGNVYRVLARVLGIETPINTTAGKHEFNAVAQELLPMHQSAAYNQAVMDFGAMVCTPKSPKCTQCPLAERCVAFREQRVGQLPVKLKKIEVKRRRMDYLHIRCKGKIAVRKRLKNDIWRGLWELVLMDDDLKTSIIPHWKGLEKNFVLWKKGVKHVLTHRVILTDFFLLEVNEPPALPPDYIWIEEIDFERCAKPRLIESLLENLP